MRAATLYGASDARLTEFGLAMVFASTFDGKAIPDMSSAASAARKRANWYSVRSIWRSLANRPRAVVGAVLGLSAFLLLPDGVRGAAREAVAWCVGGATYLVLAFRVMYNCTAETMRTRAARQDDSAIVILVLVLMAMFSSFAAIIGLIAQAKVASAEGKLFFVGLAGATTVISWLVMQVAFTLHYAHAYYAPHMLSDKGVSKALAFPDDATPDYWDFFYFASSFGAASQTSDVVINSKTLRRIATLHAIVSFFFNTMILALTINLAASLA
jgi:uncharacterized membrane protein